MSYEIAYGLLLDVINNLDLRDEDVTTKGFKRPCEWVSEQPEKKVKTWSTLELEQMLRKSTQTLVKGFDKKLQSLTAEVEILDEKVDHLRNVVLEQNQILKKYVRLHKKKIYNSNAMFNLCRHPINGIANNLPENPHEIQGDFSANDYSSNISDTGPVIRIENVVGETELVSQLDESNIQVEAIQSTSQINDSEIEELEIPPKTPPLMIDLCEENDVEREPVMESSSIPHKNQPNLRVVSRRIGVPSSFSETSTSSISSSSGPRSVSNSELPPLPPSRGQGHPLHEGWRPVPPSLRVGAKKLTRSIKIEWKYSVNLHPRCFAKVREYELFVCKTHNGTMECGEWELTKKIKPVKLPATFQLGPSEPNTTYYIAMRSVDVHGRTSSFGNIARIYT